MTLGDPNAYLGHAGPLASILIVLIILIGGMLALGFVTRLLVVRSWIGINIAFVYLVIGVLAYVVLGPFALSPDGPVYDAQALNFATNLGYGPEPANPWQLDSGKWGWPIILSLLYAVDGRIPVAGVLINCILMGLVAVLVAKTALVAFGRINYSVLYAVFLLFPGFLLLGPTQMREPICWLGIVLVALGYAYWSVGIHPLIGSLMMVLGVALVTWIRLPLGILVFLGLGAGILFGLLWERSGRGGLLAGFAIVAVGAVLFVDEIARVAGYDLTTIILTRNYLSAAATTGFAVNAGPLEFIGPTSLVFATFIKILVGPFPWELGPQVVWMWILANTFVWLFILALIARGWKTVSNRRVAVVYLALAGLILLGMGLTLTNYGIVVRLRGTPLVVLAIILCGAQVSSSRAKSRLSRRHLSTFKTRRTRSSLQHSRSVGGQ